MTQKQSDDASVTTERQQQQPQSTSEEDPTSEIDGGGANSEAALSELVLDHPDPPPNHPHHHGDDPHAVAAALKHPWYGLPIYRPPRQRQRWGDHQHRPHTNWGDVFFDLFYVAAAYNLGNILREDPTSTGLLFVAGLFLPILNLWTFKTHYESRFYVEADYLHMGYELALLLALASAVLHIRPLAQQAHPQQSIDMFYFCCSISVAYFLAMGRLVEVVICQVVLDQSSSMKFLFPEARRSCLRESIGNLCAGALYVAAAVHTGLAYFQHQAGNSSSGGESNYAAGSTNYDDGASVVDASESVSSNSTNNTSEETLHYVWFRNLAGENATEVSSSASSEEDTLAIWLLLGATFVGVAWFAGTVAYFTIHKTTTSHNDHSVPVNVDYTIHRYGEWTMLMLGESVLSLLIVDIVEISGYYQVFVEGIVSIVLLEYLHFQSQPSDPDSHAMRLSLPRSFVFYWCMQVYSLALIVLGVSYKMFLFEFLYVEDDGETEEYHRRRNMLGISGLEDRHLAGGTSAALRFTPEERKQRIAHFFCGSLALVFFCMDVMSLAHKGFLDKWKQCECGECSRTTKCLAMLLVILRVAVVVLVATLSQYETSSDKLSIVGLFAVLTQLLLRVSGSYVFPKDDAEDPEEKALERMVHYAAARVRDTHLNHAIVGQGSTKTRS